MTAENVVGNFPHETTSGDVHIAIYDFPNKETYIAQGRTDEKRWDWVKKAYANPFLKFSNEALWNEPKPKMAASKKIEMSKELPIEQPDECLTEEMVFAIGGIKPAHIGGEEPTFIET